MESKEPTPRRQIANQDATKKPEPGFQKLCRKIVSKWKIFSICIVIALLLFLFFWMLYWLSQNSKNLYDDDDDDDFVNSSKFITILGNIRVKLKIMPSANSENNTVFMEYNYVPSEPGINFEEDKSYHQYINTKKYFTSLTLKEEYIPFGNPEPYCLNFAWTPVVKGNITNQYQPFENMGKCLGPLKGHQIWAQNDPKVGIDVKMWRESIFNLGDCGNIENCKYTCESTFKGAYKNSICYTYNVVEKICAYVQKKKPEKGVPESWNITSGCFDNGEFAQYTKAMPGVEYLFDKVPIEIRAYIDPSLHKTQTEKPKTTPSSFSIWKLLMWLCFIIFLILIIIFVIAIIVYLITESKRKDENKRLINPNVNAGRNSSSY